MDDNTRFDAGNALPTILLVVMLCFSLFMVCTGGCHCEHRITIVSTPTEQKWHSTGANTPNH